MAKTFCTFCGEVTVHGCKNRRESHAAGAANAHAVYAQAAAAELVDHTSYTSPVDKLPSLEPVCQCASPASPEKTEALNFSTYKWHAVRDYARAVLAGLRPRAAGAGQDQCWEVYAGAEAELMNELADAEEDGRLDDGATECDDENVYVPSICLFFDSSLPPDQQAQKVLKSAKVLVQSVKGSGKTLDDVVSECEGGDDKVPDTAVQCRASAVRPQHSNRTALGRYTFKAVPGAVHRHPNYCNFVSGLVGGRFEVQPNENTCPKNVPNQKPQGYLASGDKKSKITVMFKFTLSLSVMHGSVTLHGTSADARHLHGTCTALHGSVWQFSVADVRG
ncbi:hypothetical protein GGX14DRAFT_409055 [Mycena pura]|uniref:Uncharacterized protein n=1 Tax=Mycena pura TaxID=153505 RepID=A0AAD6UJR9_9AGAR|nr:hypothetical protein GGX14DRAFT_409055 [Mycena pura]